MARPSATVLLLLSLLAVSHCRTLESDPAATSETETVAGATEIVPAGFLRLPSHRRHHPCHRGLWWARHHGVFGDGHRFHRHGDAEVVHDGEPSTREGVFEEEVKPVAEPDPDRTRPDSDDSAVRRWRKEALWRMFRHGLPHHHHEDDDEVEEDHEQEEEGTAGVKRFRRHHHRDDDDKEEEETEKMRKLFHPHAEDESDDEELEEMVRRFRKAIMRRRFHHLHGRFFRHLHHGRHHDHHHAEEEQHEGGGVVTWIKGLMNRF